MSPVLSLDVLNDGKEEVEMRRERVVEGSA
jgi:hypothetical protein